MHDQLLGNKYAPNAICHGVSNGQGTACYLISVFPIEVLTSFQPVSS